MLALLHAVELKLRAEWKNGVFDTSQLAVPALTVVILMLLIIIASDVTIVVVSSRISFEFDFLINDLIRFRFFAPLFRVEDIISFALNVIGFAEI